MACWTEPIDLGTTETPLLAVGEIQTMTANRSDPKLADITVFIGSGALGIGVSVFVGLLLSDSTFVWAILALVGAVAGHLVGYLLLRE